MTELDRRLLSISQPDIYDTYGIPNSALILAAVLAALFWMVLCGVVYLAVWGFA